MGAGRGTVVVVSKPPSGKEIASSIEERDSKYYSKIFPNEPGIFIFSFGIYGVGKLKK